MVEFNINYTPELHCFQSIVEFEGYINTNNQLNDISIHDTIMDQLHELMRIRNPDKRFSKEQLSKLAIEHIGAIDLALYGVWVYYSWSSQLVHLLPKDEFIEVRTNRNQYKITPQEQSQLNEKVVGIIGLSVGQSVALTMAMERSFGEIRLADYDTLDLSNLNRLRAKVYQLGLPKTVICAREIMEIDPFLKLVLYSDGIDENNIDDFLTKGKKLDLLVEECDGLDVKILSRFKARDFGIPVIMDTNDRGLLDIERFDLEPKRAILHGLVGDLDPAKLKGLSQEDKIEFLLPMVGLNALSERMKASMIEIQNSIVSWPQLASSVTMGGGVVSEMARKILLNQSAISGRFYIDLDELVADEKLEIVANASYQILAPLEDAVIKRMCVGIELPKVKNILTEDEKLKVIAAAIMAPSGGNTQPWRLIFEKEHLLLIHDIYHSQSFLDYGHLGSYVGFGAMVENISIQAAALGYKLKTRYMPEPKESRIIAACSFEKDSSIIGSDRKVEAIFKRITNRKIGDKHLISTDFKNSLLEINNQSNTAKLLLIEDESTMTALADVLSTAEMLLLLHPQGHNDMFNKELRFNEKEVNETRDGLDIATLNLSKAEVMALKIASSRKAIEWIERIGGGEAFKKNTKKAIATSSALGIITMPFGTNEAYLHAGEFLQKIWIASTMFEYSFQPITQYSYLMARMTHGKGIGFSESYQSKFNDLGLRFQRILPETITKEVIFIFRLAKEKDATVRSLRRNIDRILVK
jgi:hypothetical protein